MARLKLHVCTEAQSNKRMVLGRAGRRRLPNIGLGLLRCVACKVALQMQRMIHFYWDMSLYKKSSLQIKGEASLQPFSVP